MSWVAKGAALAALGATLSGCAKFPANGAAQYTKITFTVTMGGPINPNYLYYVAMYASTDLNPVPSTVTPIPVITTGSPDGWLTGDATNYVQMNPQNTARPYAIYSVGSPTNPGATPDTQTGNTNDQIFLDSQGNYPSTWSFTVYTTDLTAGNTVLANQLQSLTFQIITMNKLALGSASGRIMDAIGTGTSFDALTIPLNSSILKTNASYGGIEPSNDTVGGYDPSLDIIDFSVQVTTP